MRTDRNAEYFVGGIGREHCPKLIKGITTWRTSPHQIY